MDPIITGSLIAGGASLLGSLFGGGESGGSQTSQAQPASWEADAKLFWDEFINNWYGTPEITAEDTAQRQQVLRGYLPVYKQVFSDPSDTSYMVGDAYSGSGRLVGYVKESDVPREGMWKQEDLPPAVLPAQTYEAMFGPTAALDQTVGVPSYQQRIEQDVAARKSAGEQFNQAASAAEQPYANLLRGLTQSPQQYYKPIGFKAGDFQASFVPRTDLRYVDELKKAALERSMLGTQAAGRDLSLAETYTPNKAFTDYMAQLQSLATSLNAQRYGVPSTATSATGSYSPSWAESLNNALKIYQSIAGNQGAANPISTTDLSNISTADLMSGNYNWPS